MKLECRSCGAEIVFEPGQQALACEYCGTVNEIRPQGAPDYTPPAAFERIVPMRVTPQALDDRVLAYIASGDFTPDDMLEHARITLRERYYVPVFVFQVDYQATWQAYFGFDRQEPYTEYRMVNGRRQAYTAHRTVTDWRPASGSDSGHFAIGAYGGKKLGSEGLAPAALAARAAAEGDAIAYDASYTAGFEVESFTRPQAQALAALERDIDQRIGQRVKRHAQGDRQRDWRWNAQHSHTCATCAAPICHAVYEYGGKSYHVWLGGHAEGRDNTAISADPLPVDEGKKSAATLGLLPGAAGLLSMLGSGAYWENFSTASLLAVVLAFGWGLMRRHALLAHSRAVREALFVQRQASSRASVNMSDEERARITQAFQRPVRPFLARTARDRIVVPALTALSVAGGALPNAPDNVFDSSAPPAHTAPWSR